jgi:hypothetical protein
MAYTSRVELPPERRLRWLLRGAARLVDGGAEPVRGLIQPTGRHFPDHFDGSSAAVKRLLLRIREHAGLTDVPVELEIAGASDAQGGGCSSGSCCGPAKGGGGPLRRVRAADGPDAGYVVAVAAAEVGNPTVLTAGLVRAVSHIFMKEADLYGEFERSEYEPVVDLAGVLLGFGVLLANASYIYSKGCGGVNIASATVLPAEEIAAALAIFCQLHQSPVREARSHLEPTPRALLDEGLLWARSNAGVIRLVRSDRAALDADSYSLSEGRGWLSRLFGLGRASGPSVPTDEELEQMARKLPSGASKSERDPEKERRLKEIRELVDEALDS